MIKGRYWLLDSAVESGIPLHWLSASNISELLNRPGHGCSVEEIAHALTAMVQAGELAVSGRHELKRENGMYDQRRIRELIAKPTHEFQPCWYHLTKCGGTAWEQWARPDWLRYNTSSGHVRGIAIRAASDALARELFELERHFHCEREILLECRVIKVLRPWRATYWKSLPEGHLIAAAFRPRRSSEQPLALEGAWARWCALRRWYDRPEA